MQEAQNRHLYSLPLPLSWLLDLDDCAAPGALTDAFGDSYLNRYNPVFAGVRRAALAAGYSFSAEDSAFSRDYRNFGLVTLHQILANKQIPYFDTGATLRRLLRQNPKWAMSPGLMMDTLRRNHVFHESAHCVAHSVLGGMREELMGEARSEQSRFVLESVLAESFANTAENLGTVCRHLPLSDALFYGLNSYVTPADKKIDLLLKAGEELGDATRFGLLFFASFEANLAVSDWDGELVERVALAGRTDAAEAEPLVKLAFGLNPTFRKNTTPEYFRLLGYSDEYQALRKSNWLGGHGNRDFSSRLAETLYRVISFSI